MNNYISIDIGSENIKILFISQSENSGNLKIISKETYPTAGVSYGYINNQKELIRSLGTAISQFEKNNKIKINEAFFSVNGYGIKGTKIKASYQVAAGIISDYDLEKIQKKSKSILKRINNDQIIDTFEIKYLINGFEHYSNPKNLESKKFESEVLFITKPKNNLKNLEESIEKTGVVPISFIPALIASGENNLNELDKKLGCALVDIGAETTSIVVYENNKPIYYNVLKIGSKNITKKISLEEKIDFSKAEKIKRGQILNKKIDKIIEKELKNISKKISDEIKKAEREKLLPGGITLSGGGSRISKIEEIFKKELSLPVKKIKNISDNHTDYHIAYGAILEGIKEERENKTFPFPKIDLKKFLKLPQKIIKKLIP